MKKYKKIILSAIASLMLLGSIQAAYASYYCIVLFGTRYCYQKP